MLNSFTAHLKSSNRILALFGAGLFAASGLPTYRSPSSFWRTYSGQQLATPKKFEEDPGLAVPNEAHVALARLAGVKGRLCQRAGHPATQIVDFHCSLFHVRCVDGACGYEAGNLTSPITPALALPNGVDIADASVPLPDVGVDELPQCPKCKTDLLRPAVFWFGEGVPEEREVKVENEGRDLMLVVGTSAVVYPAAAYITKARERGARVAFSIWRLKVAGIARPESEDWSFVGAAAVLVP
ncbi:DHS-like NAD/FAD-binding domain-containing protein [Mytilinidion resinicola]|uniref:DHS-like NAD/FAD-binding domain-containing protein n=1 Tax=Mytilinidion resinicola TaxID=574789 RepID=A0A6A6YUV1_9PEZI|nr:DHS-like NAD/FAD-binding domain-containing protein [Mytilinidion resinicola]KAF2812736.1 DHS-like NAD/FAD-binding domain-containing protein [Mytilinidion resinicola]